MRASNHDPMPRLAAICEDDAEMLALSVARFAVASFVARDIACRDGAFDGSKESLGADDGGRFVAAMVGALRAEREDEWSFMPATCCRLTGHECVPRLVAALRSAVVPNDAAAARHAGTKRPAATALH